MSESSASTGGRSPPYDASEELAMTLDKDTLRPRRAVLAAALGGIAATVATAVARPDVVRAGSDGDVVLGALNTTAGQTTISSTAETALSVGGGTTGIRASGGLEGVNGLTSAGYGVRGQSQTSYGVFGQSDSVAGVYGESYYGAGAVGASRAFGDPLPGAPAKTGVFGYAAQDSDARGVHGQSTSGRGVFGQATTGQGVRGYATTGSALYGSTSSAKSGYALRTVGRVKLEKSVGIATVSAGSNRVTVTPGIDITSTSAVVATLQGSAGGKTTVHRVSVSTTGDTFTIYLTANATASVRVAWHILG
jgi:hypothetical protein